MSPALKSSQDQILNLGAYLPAVEKRLQDWENAEFASRFWGKDPTLWAPNPIPEITDRMGWLDLFEPMHDQLKTLFDFAEEIRKDGFRQIVLLGMGGSSLAPEVYQRIFRNEPEYPSLSVLDTTHPMAVRALESKLDLEKTLFIVSSKSGTTIETLSGFYYFWNRVKDKNPTPGKQFIAISDPGTPLVKLAQERGFRRVFEAQPDIGGRYSALTFFGLVPAVLLGIDIHQLIDRGWDMAGASASYLSETQNPSLILGAALGELALAGRDKITFFTTPSLTAFPSWVEQLIAESTGKSGKGIIPIVDEIIEQPWVYRKDRAFVFYALNSENNTELNANIRDIEDAGHPMIHLSLNNKYDLGQEIFRWEMAVPAAGAVLGIHPFDQPDVQLAKDLARQAMEQKPSKGGRPEKSDVETFNIDQKVIISKAFDSFLAGARLGDYFSVQAYLAPDDNTLAILQDFRLSIRDRLKLASTFGWGPRFLHSTGQLYKGGPNTGIFIQLVDEPQDDVPVPETTYTFGQLIQAQSMGDYRAMKQKGRRVLRINLGRDIEKGLGRLSDLLI